MFLREYSRLTVVCVLVTGLAVLVLYWRQNASDSEKMPHCDPDYELISVPSGTFLMGTDSKMIPVIVREDIAASGHAEAEASPIAPIPAWLNYAWRIAVLKAETPLSCSAVPCFKIGKGEVSNRQYARFLKHCLEAHDLSFCHPDEPCDKDHTPGVVNDLSFGERVERFPDQPVTCVDWYDAYAYAKWSGLDLPTETQWEYAAKGAKGGPYPWGAHMPDDLDVSYSRNERFRGKVTVCGAADHDLSPFGVRDMAGNVAEWCRNRYVSRKGGLSEGEDNPGCRVVRGGSFDDTRFYLRCASRRVLQPLERYCWLGIRCVQNDSPELLAKADRIDDQYYRRWRDEPVPTHVPPPPPKVAREKIVQAMEGIMSSDFLTRYESIKFIREKVGIILGSKVAHVAEMPGNQKPLVIYEVTELFRLLPDSSVDERNKSRLMLERWYESNGNYLYWAPGEVRILVEQNAKKAGIPIEKWQEMTKDEREAVLKAVEGER